MRRIPAGLLLFWAGCGVPMVSAGAKSQAVKVVAGTVMERAGQAAAKEGTELLARQIEQAAARHGGPVLAAVKRIGPKALPIVERAGAHGAQAAKVIARHGEQGVVFVASRPKAMQLVAAHGEEAASVLVKSHGVAEHAIESLGKPAVKAFEAVGKPQNVRRLAMMAAEGGELAKAGSRGTELLGVIEKYGDPAMEFIWKNKAPLAATAVMAAFLASPGEFISGAKDVTKIVTENTIKPLAEVPGLAVKEAAREVAKSTNWTVVFGLMIGIVGSLFAYRMFRRPRVV